MTEEIQEKKRFNIKLDRKDKIALVALIAFVILMAIPIYISKGDCEVLRPGGECASTREVMIENCAYWGQYSCDTTKDVSLPQIEWYIENMCKFSSKKYNLDCSNLQLA